MFGVPNTKLICFSTLQFFPTADEVIDYFNQKRCVDGKALILPSQIVSFSKIEECFLFTRRCFQIKVIGNFPVLCRGMSSTLNVSWQSSKENIRLVVGKQMQYMFRNLSRYLRVKKVLKVMCSHRCMLRGFRLHNCPYWVRPSITISDHNGIFYIRITESCTLSCTFYEILWCKSRTLFSCFRQSFLNPIKIKINCFMSMPYLLFHEV